MKNKLSLLYVLGFTALSNYVFSQCANSGIGTTSPGAKLEVRGCTNDSTTAALKVANSTDTTNNPILFIRNDNRIGIGTKFPQTMLDVNGTIFSRTGGFKFPDGTTQTTAAGAGANIWSLGSGQYSIINNLAGGNITNALSSFIGAGLTNTISVTGNNSIILGGQNNYVGDDNSVILSGSGNTIQDPVGMPGPPAESYNFISGGIGNTIHSNTTHSAIIQGTNNSIISGVSNVVILGGTNIAGVQSNTVYMPNICVTSWIGSGDRQIVADSAGNLKIISNACLGPQNWSTTGTTVLQNCNPFIGTLNNYPFIVQTNSVERMRILGSGANAGNVGIGTTTPYKMLTVNGDVSFANYNNSGSGNLGDGFTGLEILGDDAMPTRRGISVDNDPHGSLNFYINTNQNPSSFNFINGNAGTLMTVNGVTSNVGIGTTNPGAKLHVVGVESNQTGIVAAFSGTASGGAFIQLTDATNWNWGIGGRAGTTGDLSIFADRYPGNIGTEYLTIQRSTGSVGIGTATPTSGTLLDVNGAVGINTSSLPSGATSGYMLAVNGKVIAEEYFAKLHAYWPDYVFKKEYKLKGLNELDNYIKENQHLPDMPSANEVAKSGVPLGEMVTKQMEKIEELTLYMIQMNKELQSLKEENEKLKQARK